jgi:hypothetical protein
MIDLPVLRARLAEAEQALHDLALGGSVVSISDNERKITFTAANIGQLRGYIDDLRRQIAELECPLPPRRGPVVFTF